MNFVLVLSTVLLCTIVPYIANIEECEYILETEKLCINKPFDPSDIIHAPTYSPIGIRFIDMVGNTRLIISRNYTTKGSDYAIYKSFVIENSCVQDIQDDFFFNLDKNTEKLDSITFKNVTCLRKLSSKAFRGIGKFVKTLIFDTMPSLSEIDNDFFDSLNTLEKLTIIKTGIETLPEQMLLKMPNLMQLSVNSNRLTGFPWIQNDRQSLFDNLQAYNNPFNCRCALTPLKTVVQRLPYSKQYICATPPQFHNQALVDVELCEQIYSTVKSVKGAQPLATAHVRIEIIIAASILVLVIVIIVLVVVLYKRHKQQKKQKHSYDQVSPSKIIFQNEHEFAQPFVMTYKS